MSLSYSRQQLSGSTDNLPIKVAATATPGTTIHTATALTGALGFDEIYLAVTNTDTSPVNLTLEWGGTTDPDHLISKAVPIPANAGPVWIVTGNQLNNAKVVKAFASVANKLLITGYVNRIS
jgi:hypothetical protein